MGVGAVTHLGIGLISAFVWLDEEGFVVIHIPVFSFKKNKKNKNVHLNYSRELLIQTGNLRTDQFFLTSQARQYVLVSDFS